MEKLQVTTTINAPVAKVWDTMLNDETYRVWTAAFNPGSYYKGDWSEGSKILFLGPNPDGTPGEGGMVSRIAVNKPHEFISIEHLGLVMNGVEDTTSEIAKQWAPAFENYTFLDKGDSTDLIIDMETMPENMEEFKRMWPAALEKLKELCER